jgi:hypothetical protein
MELEAAFWFAAMELGIAGFYSRVKSAMEERLVVMVYRGRVSNNWVTCMGLEYGRRGDWLGTWTRRPDLLWQKMDLLSPQPTHVGQGVCFHFAPFREIQRRRLTACSFGWWLMAGADLL